MIFHIFSSLSNKISVQPTQAGPKDDIAHIIVSRSHTGDVEVVAKSAFGDKTNITQAGGAGECHRGGGGNGDGKGNEKLEGNGERKWARERGREKLT